MTKSILFLSLLFILSVGCYGQKIIQKEFDLRPIHTLSIVDEALFKIAVISSEEKSIRMKLHVSGEHSENIVLEEKIENGTLFLTTGFSPFVELENDKLAAHKVMALQMEIFVPSSISIAIKSTLAS